jgi:hypothetical protein
MNYVVIIPISVSIQVGIFSFLAIVGLTDTLSKLVWRSVAQTKY